MNDSDARRSDIATLFDDATAPAPDESLRNVRAAAKRIFGLDEADGPFEAGESCGPYRIVRLLGTGGQAFVYEAEKDGERVALKVPRAEVSTRLLHEVKVAGAVDHPNILSIRDTGQVGERTYLVMDLCRGGDLSERLRNTEGGLPLDQVRSIATAILEGLAAAHDRGIVHRDLKPSNILFDADGHPKIGDLGIGILAGADPDLAQSLTLTRPDGGEMAGTPLYMAPEQLDPEKASQLDGRTDLFAFGKILYQMLTGGHPSTIRPPSRVRDELDENWDEILFRLVEDNPDDRFESATAVLQALRPLFPPEKPTFERESEPFERPEVGPGRFFAHIGVLGFLSMVVAIGISAVFIPDNPGLFAVGAPFFLLGSIFLYLNYREHRVVRRAARWNHVLQLAASLGVWALNGSLFFFFLELGKDWYVFPTWSFSGFFAGLSTLLLVSFLRWGGTASDASSRSGGPTLLGFGLGGLPLALFASSVGMAGAEGGFGLLVGLPWFAVAGLFLYLGWREERVVRPAEGLHLVQLPVCFGVWALSGSAVIRLLVRGEHGDDLAGPMSLFMILTAMGVYLLRSFLRHGQEVRETGDRRRRSGWVFFLSALLLLLWGFVGIPIGTSFLPPVGPIDGSTPWVGFFLGSGAFAFLGGVILGFLSYREANVVRRPARRRDRVLVPGMFTGLAASSGAFLEAISRADLNGPATTGAEIPVVLSSFLCLGLMIATGVTVYRYVQWGRGLQETPTGGEDGSAERVEGETRS